MEEIRGNHPLRLAQSALRVVQAQALVVDRYAQEALVLVDLQKISVVEEEDPNYEITL